MARSKQHCRAPRSHGRSAQTQTVPPNGALPRWSLIVAINSFLAGLGVATMALLALAPSIGVGTVSRRGTAIAGGSSTPRFTELVSIAPEALAGSDIARLNLIAAEGLPGAENLSVEKVLAELDRWATHVQRETDRHLYKYAADPANFENSEAYFRILMLITVLQQDLGVHYNPDRINDPDFSNSQDLFISGMVGSDNGGTCVSMPVLYVAVGRRLGYPLNLVVTKGHVFARWEDERERFNIEGAGQGFSMHSDEHYTTWPYKLSEAEINNNWFLRSLTPAEELGVFLMQRGHCLESTGRRLDEAQIAYALAHRFAPKSPEGLAYLAALVRKESALLLANPVDPEVLAAQSTRDPLPAWLMQKRRESKDIALQAIERASGRTGAPAPGPNAPPPSGSLLPGTPSSPGRGN